MKTVYLAGPITGLSFEGCTNWRKSCVEELAEFDIIGLSPMRAKDYLNSESAVGDSYPNTVLSSSKGIITRDRWDTTRCDVILVNLLGAERVSIGTVMEIAWADLSRIPIVLVMEPEGNLHDHSMIREAIGFRVTSLQEGLDVVKALLLPSGR